MKKRKIKNLSLRKTTVSNFKGGNDSIDAALTSKYTDDCTVYDCGGNTLTLTCDWQCQDLTLHVCHTIRDCWSKWPANCG